MENKFKNKDYKPTKQNTDEVTYTGSGHPNCTMTKEEVKNMSYILPTSKLRSKFFRATYLMGMDPDATMMNMLSDPEVQSMLDDMSLTGCAPRIPAKFRVPNHQKPEKGGPPKGSQKGPSRRPPGAGPADSQFFEQECQRLISNMSNVGAEGMLPFVMPMGQEEPFQDKRQFDGRQERPGERNSLGPIAELAGVDGPLKEEYERLLSNVQKIGGFDNINLDVPVQNHPDFSGPGPSVQKRKSFQDQHIEPKRGRYPEEAGPGGMQQGPHHVSPPPRKRRRPRHRGPPFLEDPHIGRPDMPTEMQQRPGQNREFHGDMSSFIDEPRGNIPPFHDGPQQPPFYDGPPRQFFHDGPQQPPFHDGAQQPPFHDGPQQPPFHDGPQQPPFHDGAQQPPFHDGPHRRSFHDGPQQSPFHDGPQRQSFHNGPKGPPLNSEFRGDMQPFNNRPHRNERLFHNEPQGNRPQLNSGPQGNMPPFNSGPQGNVPSFNIRPQGNGRPFNNPGPHANVSTFDSGPNISMQSSSHMPHGDMQPFGRSQNNPQNDWHNGDKQPFNKFRGSMPPSNQKYGIMDPDLQHRQPPHMPRVDDRGMQPGPSRGTSYQSDPPYMEQPRVGNDFGLGRGMPTASDPQSPKRSTASDAVSKTEGDPRAPMFIVPIRYPSERFSEKQMDAIENAILEAILEIDDERLKPTFQKSFRSSGRYGVICNDQLSKNWLFSFLITCRPWPYASFKVISAQPTKIKADALLPLCKNDDDEKILKFIAKQNTKLNVSQWEVVQRLDGACSTSLSLAIDEESADVLKGSSTINFKMGRAQIVVADQSITGNSDELITRALQKKRKEIELEESERSHMDQRLSAHSEPMSSNLKPRGLQELCVTSRDASSERNTDHQRGARSRSRMVQLPTPPPPPAIGNAMRFSKSSEHGGSNEYEPSRSDRFFRTPSPELRETDTRERSRHDPGRTQPLRVPRSGGHIERDPNRNDTRESFQRSGSGSVASNRTPTIERNSRRQRPSQPDLISYPSRNSRPNFPSHR